MKKLSLFRITRQNFLKNTYSWGIRYRKGKPILRGKEKNCFDLNGFQKIAIHIGKQIYSNKPEGKV